MARQFSKNTANYLSLGTSTLASLVSGAASLSLHARMHGSSFSTGINDNGIIGGIIDGTAIGIQLSISSSPSKVRCAGKSQAADATLQSVNGATTVSTGTWYSVGGVLQIGADNIRVYLDGIQDASTAVTFGASTFTPGTPTQADGLGTRNVPPATTATQFNGHLAEVAIWTDDITTAGFEQLADGYSPLMVRPDALVFYAPLIGRYSPEVDLISSSSGTITGTISASDHPRVIYPSSQRSFGMTPNPPPAGPAMAMQQLSNVAVDEGY